MKFSENKIPTKQHKSKTEIIICVVQTRNFTTFAQSGLKTVLRWLVESEMYPKIYLRK